MRRLLLVALVGVLASAAGVIPAAGAAGNGLSVSTHKSWVVGHRPRIEVKLDGQPAGHVRVVVSHTFGEGKGLPKDTRVWQQRVAYDGSKALVVDGPVVRVGDYRIRVFFTPGSGDAAPGAELQSSTTFSVVPVEPGAPSKADVRKPDAESAGGWSWSLTLLVVVLGLAAAAVALVRRQGRGAHSA